MKLIDRYILRTFLVPLGYCLAAFSLIFIIFDLTDNLPEFLKAQTPLVKVLQFYLILLPSVLIYIVPVSLMLAVLYSLTQLTRHNEITAMRASGINLYRIVFPFFAAGLLSSAAVSAVHETLGARSAFWSHQFINLQYHEGDESVYEARNLGHRNTDEYRTWLVGRFHTKTFDLDNVEVIQQRTNHVDFARITARHAEWLDGRWWFYDVRIQRYNERGDPVGLPVYVRRREMAEFNETPDDFMNEIKDPEFLATYEILHYIKTHPLSDKRTAQLMVDFHHRLAMPWACLIVTMIGIPFGTHTARRGAFLGVALTIGLFFGYYAIMMVFESMGKNMTLPPAAAAWGANGLFLVIALALIHRMR